MSQTNIINKCLFPVAGYGTRFLPATKSMPKEMLPVVNKPLIQYAAEEAMDAGLTDLSFVTGRNKRAIPDHFDISYELEREIEGSGKETYLKDINRVLDTCTFTYTRQRHMLGLGHAVLTGETMINQSPFGLVLADDLCVSEPGAPGVLSQLVGLYKQFRCSIIAVQEVPESEVHKYGIVAGNQIKDGIIQVENMVEKPAPEDAPSNLAVIGRYILTPDIFDLIRSTPPGKNGEIQLTDALQAQARDGCVMACRFKGRRFDCGSVDGFVEATNWVYENQYRNPV